ncbi:MAG: maltokinase N-terminal cap-like domain-containing protein [Actinomycetes bacterium]
MIPDVSRRQQAASSLDAPDPLEDGAAEQLLGVLSSARWFAGKGRRAALTGLKRLPWLTPASSWPAVRFEIVEISYPPGASGTAGAKTPVPYELYSLPVAYWPGPQPGLAAAEMGPRTDPELGPVVAYDAARDPAACRVLLAALLDERRAGQAGESVEFHLSRPGVLSADLEPRVFTGQQSNTSVMLGEVAMIKLFRRLELGHNLDIEVHEALSLTGLADVAQLYGWVGASWRHREEPVRADLARVVEKLVDAEDGWELALSSLREGRSFADAAAALGTALAETHAGLRSAFPPGTQSGAELAQVMTARLVAARSHAPQLDPYAAGLEELFAGLGGRDLDTQRVHGDFHLGQTLHTPNGWKIIDFEGEPAKTLAERAVPDSAWRDIAGMLRSFAYAAASVPGPRSAAWGQECRRAFLEAYAGGPLAEADAAVLRAYEADKAVYEVVYEVRNRPDWVGIPLAAVAALTDTAAVSAEPDTAAVSAVPDTAAVAAPATDAKE